MKEESLKLSNLSSFSKFIICKGGSQVEEEKVVMGVKVVMVARQEKER